MTLSRREWLLSTAAMLSTVSPALAKPGRIALGFSLYGMKSLPLREAIEACAKIGYDGIELSCMPGYLSDPKKLDATARKDLKKLLTDHGLQLMGLMLNINEPADAAKHKSNLEEIKAAAELGHSLANAMPPIETVLGGKPSEWGERKDKVVESLQSWAKAAKAADVRIAIKPHVSNALHAPADALWVIEKVNSLHIKLAYDYSHFVLQEMQLKETMDAIIPQTIFTHVKDAKGKPAKFEFLLPGEEGIDYTKYVQHLTDLKYGGPVVVEVSGMISNKKDYDPIVAAKKSYANLSKAFGR